MDVSQMKHTSYVIHNGKWLETWARFTNEFLPVIQIWWKIRLAVIPLLSIRSQQFFADATTP